MTVAIAPLDAEIVLGSDIADAKTAKAITARIRAWVDAFPMADVQLAYEGRIWLAMGCDSWAEWCARELDGFKLPMTDRSQTVAELAASNMGTEEKPYYMSNEAIANVLGVDEATIRRDIKSTPVFAGVDLAARPTMGKDGKVRKARQPGDPDPDPDPKPTPSPPDPSKEERQRHNEAAFISGIMLSFQPSRMPGFSKWAKRELIKELKKAITNLEESLEK